MFPYFLIVNVCNNVSGNAKHFRYFFMKKFISGKKILYLLDIVFRKLRLGVSFAMSHSSLSGGILNVLSWCPKKKMRWPNTRWHIAFMANTISVFNWSTIKNPRNTMCAYAFIDSFLPIPRESKSKDSMSEMTFKSSPQPTRRSFLDVFPKTFFNWDAFLVSLNIDEIFPVHGNNRIQEMRG